MGDIILAGGGVTRLSEKLGLHHTSIIGWRKTGRVPAERVLAVADATGLSPSAIRPDLFRLGITPNAEKAA